MSSGRMWAWQRKAFGELVDIGVVRLWPRCRRSLLVELLRLLETIVSIGFRSSVPRRLLRQLRRQQLLLLLLSGRILQRERYLQR